MNMDDWTKAGFTPREQALVEDVLSVMSDALRALAAEVGVLRNRVAELERRKGGPERAA